MRLSTGLRLWFVSAGLSFVVLLFVTLMGTYAHYKGFNATPMPLYMFSGMLMMGFFGAWVPQILCMIGIAAGIFEWRTKSDAKFIKLGFYLNVVFIMGATFVWWFLV